MKRVVNFWGLVSLLLTLATSVVSCEKDPVEQPEENNIVIYDQTLEALPEGEVVRFNYDIENRTEGVDLKVECDSEWVTDIVVYESLVDVTVERNTSGEKRSAILELRYASEHTTIVLTQEPWIAPITLTVDKVETTAITISIATLDENTTWIGQIVGRDWFESYTEEEIFAEDYKYYRSMASEMELSIEEYLATILSRGSHSGLRMSGLDAETDYVVYVYGLSEAGVKTTEIFYEAFTTTPPYEGNDVTFDIHVECERALATISVVPLHEGVAYYHNITTREHFEECGSDVNRLADDVLAAALENYVYWGYSEAEFFEYNAEYLATTYEFEAMADTEYIVFAFKWSEELERMSEVSYVWFKTAAIPPSDNQLGMTISDVTQTTFYIETTTTNNDPYTIFAAPRNDIAKMRNDDEVLNYIVETYGAVELEYNKCQGPVSGTFSGLEANTEYVVLLFGYEAGVRTTDMVRQNIKTLEAGDVEACIYEAEITNITDRQAHLNITPSDFSIWYYWNVFETSMSEEDIKAYILNAYNRYYYADYWEFSYYELAQGIVDSNLTQLRPSTDYKVIVVPMDQYKFEYIGSMRTVGEFRTEEAIYADITITAGFDAYYDGDEVYEIEPDYLSNYRGCAIIPMSVNIDGEYANFLYTIFTYEEGLDDPAVYSDDVLLENLYSVGAYWTPAYFRGEWDVPMMIAAVAFDKSGNPSRVYRECFTCTREGAGDAQEFVDYYMGTISSRTGLGEVSKSCVVEDAPELKPMLKSECRERSIRLIKR